MGLFGDKDVWDQSIMVRQPRHWTACSRPRSWGGEEEEEAKPKSAPKSRSFTPPRPPSFVTRKIGIKPRAPSSGFLDWKDWWRPDALHWTTSDHLNNAKKAAEGEERRLLKEDRGRKPISQTGAAKATCLGPVWGWVGPRGSTSEDEACYSVLIFVNISSFVLGSQMAAVWGKPGILKQNRFQIKMI